MTKRTRPDETTRRKKRLKNFTNITERSKTDAKVKKVINKVDKDLKDSIADYRDHDGPEYRKENLRLRNKAAKKTLELREQKKK